MYNVKYSANNLNHLSLSTLNYSLSVAIYQGNITQVKELLEAGANPNSFEGALHSLPPLIQVIARLYNAKRILSLANTDENLINNLKAIMDILLNNEIIDINQLDKQNRTALDHAFSTCNTLMIETLQNKNAKSSKDLFSQDMTNLAQDFNKRF